MKFLQFPECFHDIVAFSEFLGLFAEFFLHFEIFFEIKVAKLPVYLYHVVELFHIQLIGIVKIPVILHRNRTDGPPPVLYLPECRESRIHVLLFFKQGFQILDDSFLLFEIVLPLLLLLAVVLCPFLSVGIVHRLERLLYLVERIVSSRLFMSFRRIFLRYRILLVFVRDDRVGRYYSGFRLFLDKVLVEGALYGFGFLVQFHPVFIFDKILEHAYKLCKALFRIIYDAFFRLCYIRCQHCIGDQIFTHRI